MSGAAPAQTCGRLLARHLLDGVACEVRLPPRPSRVRAGWERIVPPGARPDSKLDAIYRHVASGIEIRHCGHPTANFPYLIYGPNGKTFVAPNGRGYMRLTEAQAAVEGAL